MNILVIGNGFDLAHGLPTKFTDFLKFVGVYIENRDIFRKKQSLENKWREFNKENQDRVMFFSILHEHNKKLFLELDKLISNNVWIEYFMSIYEERIKNGKDGWIDFESEISQIIKSFTDIMTGWGYSLYDQELDFRDGNTYNLYPGYLKINELIKQCCNIPILQRISYLTIRDCLLSDLGKLIRALEIYLTDCVEKIEITKISKDIKELDIDHVLSFNYTDTFEKLYGENNNIEYDYIHGKADISNTIESNNMVLGIDEYLDDDRKNKDVEFLAFKKYYQRIYKQTGCKYKEWVDEIRESGKEIEIKFRKEFPTQIPFNNFYHKHYMYIFGHSLDMTDGDILRELILNDNVHTTIFYHNKDVMGQQIANLVKVIGQDKLIKRTGGSTKTIEFKQQQDMVDIEDNTT
ncbi:hypothetical protein D7V86_24940 [bacterium D16-51]|nr:hypothetical protein D7V96_24035 [bacterium D16-59]RKI53524.1 hypothetical protein D7V86_24940 [bacterium D16-51]